MTCFLEAGRDGRLAHVGALSMDLGDGRTPLTQQIRVAIYSKVAKEKISRWLRVRADIRTRSGEGESITLYSPPFYSLSKLNTTMMAKGIFEKDPTTGLIKIVVDAKNYLMREDGPARGPAIPQSISYGAMADAAAAGLIRASIAARLELADLQGIEGGPFESSSGDSSAGPYHPHQDQLYQAAQYLHSPYESVQNQGHPSSMMHTMAHDSSFHSLHPTQGHKNGPGVGRGGRSMVADINEAGLVNQADGQFGSVFENQGVSSVVAGDSLQPFQIVEPSSISTEQFDASSGGERGEGAGGGVVNEGSGEEEQKLIARRQELGLLVAGSDLAIAPDDASLREALRQEGQAHQQHFQHQIQQNHMQRVQYQMQQQQQQMHHQNHQQQQFHHQHLQQQQHIQQQHMHHQHMQHQHMQQQQHHHQMQQQHIQMAPYYDQRVLHQPQGQFQHHDQEIYDQTQEHKRQYLQHPMPMNHHLQQHQQVQLQMRGNNFASFDMMPYSAPSMIHPGPIPRHQTDQVNVQNNQLYQLQLQRQHLIQAEGESIQSQHQQEQLRHMQFQMHPQQHIEQGHHQLQQVGQMHAGQQHQAEMERVGEIGTPNFQPGILRLGDQMTSLHHREGPMSASARQYAQAHTERVETHAIDRHRERREKSMNLLRSGATESRESRDETTFRDSQAHSQEEAEERHRQHQLYMLMFPSTTNIDPPPPPPARPAHNIGGLDPESGLLVPFSQESQGSVPEVDNSFSQPHLSQSNVSQSNLSQPNDVSTTGL